jgi:hypothetical protein
MRHSRILTASDKAALTRTLKKLHPEYAGTDVKWSDFNHDEINNAMIYIAERKKRRENKKLMWTKMQIIKYLNKYGIKHDFTTKNIPNAVVKELSGNDRFLNFKKFEGYRLLFRKIKKRMPDSDREVKDFIRLLKEEQKDR